MTNLERVKHCTDLLNRTPLWRVFRRRKLRKMMTKLNDEWWEERVKEGKVIFTYRDKDFTVKDAKEWARQANEEQAKKMKEWGK